MTDRDRTLGEQLGDAAGAVKSKVNEVADRARAEGHDAKSEATNNPLESVVEKGKAAVDRAKAGYHEAEAESKADRLDR